MFSNPIFEWWLESLENRRLHSAVGAASSPDAPFPARDAAEDAPIISIPSQRHAGTFSTRVAPNPTPPDAAPTADDAFVTDWFLPAPGNNSVR